MEFHGWGVRHLMKCYALYEFARLSAYLLNGVLPLLLNPSVDSSGFTLPEFLNRTFVSGTTRMEKTSFLRCIFGRTLRRTNPNQHIKRAKKFFGKVIPKSFSERKPQVALLEKKKFNKMRNE
jgi:hypothetical protein